MSETVVDDVNSEQLVVGSLQVKQIIGENYDWIGHLKPVIICLTYVCRASYVSVLRH